MSDKTDNKDRLRHIDKTRQDHQPVAERQRVKDWQKRIHNMRVGLIGPTPSDTSESHEHEIV